MIFNEKLLFLVFLTCAILHMLDKPKKKMYSFRPFLLKKVVEIMKLSYMCVTITILSLSVLLMSVPEHSLGIQNLVIILSKSQCRESKSVITKHKIGIINENLHQR